MRVTQYRIEGLGHLSTLIADEAAGVAAVVDPRRDVDIYLAAARAADLRITHVLETHLHNDYVSGGRDLAALTGATHVIGAGAELRHDHRPARDGETFDVGALRFRTLDTPGHTPEHVSYAVADTTRADEPFLLLTGGSLLVGAVGRTDLLGAEHALPYAAAMYRSLHDVLLRHEDSVMVYPTHGAGSLCSTGIASTSWSTIGYERRHDPLLGAARGGCLRPGAAGRPADLPALLRPDAPDQPGRAAAARRGRARRSRPLSGDDLDGRAGPRGARSSTRRPPEAHARERDPGLAVDPGRVVVRDVARLGRRRRPAGRPAGRRTSADLDDLARQALRIGFESIVGYVDGGFARLAAVRAAGPGRRDARRRSSWRRCLGRRAGRARSSSTSARRPSTRRATCPGSVHIGAGDLPAMLDAAAARPPDRHDLRQRLPLERRPPRCCGRPGSSGSCPCPAAFPTGRRTATRSSTGRAADESAGAADGGTEPGRGASAPIVGRPRPR